MKETVQRLEKCLFASRACNYSYNAVIDNPILKLNRGFNDYFCPKLYTNSKIEKSFNIIIPQKNRH